MQYIRIEAMIHIGMSRLYFAYIFMVFVMLFAKDYQLICHPNVAKKITGIITPVA